MSWHDQRQVPFWDFIRSLEQSGAARPGPGVDEPAGFEHQAPPGPPPPPGPGGFGGYGSWFGPRFGPSPVPHHGPHGPHEFHGGPHGFRRGRGGCGARGRHGRRGEDPERSGDDTEHERGPDGEHDPEKTAEPQSEGEGGGSDDPPRGPWERRGRGGWGGRGRGGHGYGGWERWGRHHDGPGGFAGPDGNFDLSALINTLSQHPIAQTLRNLAEQAQATQGTRDGVGADTDPSNTFTPPIDIFSTPAAYILHIALPGAKKEDVGVNWDAGKGELNIAGVVYRQGDEEFLKTLSKAERKVGVFERSVKLPPAGGQEEKEKEEVDGDSITAKLEDGVLVVTVPKVEKDWTEVKKVDIE